MPPAAHQTIEIDGSLGLETNVSNHSGDPKSFRVFRDLITDVGKRIVKRDGKGPTLGSIAGTEVQALHEYVYVDPTTGVESYHTLGAIDGGGYIYRWNFVATWAAQTLPVAPTAGGRWGFCNAGNSVLAFNGIDQLLIGQQTAANVITWKIAGVDAPGFAPTYSRTLHNGPYSVGTVSAVEGLPTITGAVPAIWQNAATPAGFAGGVILINGNAYDISTVGVLGNGTTIAPVLTLTEGFKEVTATLMSYVIYWGVGSWNDIAPQYRFSYSNPTTGHISNPSPVLQVTETFQKFVTITITIPASAENQAAYLNGYTEIQLYRTPKNAGTMVAMNEKLANVNSAVATITYIETTTKFADTFLNNFQAPLLNYKPPTGFCSMCFQQGRLFAVRRLDGHVYFTPIGVEVDFGRAIECWPPLYRLEIQAPRAVLEVGGQSATDSLVVQTSRGDFSLDGYSNVTFNPYKLQTRRSGSYLGAAADVDGQLVEFYADNRLMVMRQDVARRIQDRLSLVKPSLISKVRLHWFAANNTNYLLLSIPKGSSSTANDYTYVFDLDLEGGPIYEWNFGVSAFATVHDPTTLQLQLFAGDSTGAAYRLFSGNHQDAGGDFAPTLTTSILRGEESRQAFKYVKIWVNDARVTSGENTGWTGTLFINEQSDPNAANAEATPLVFRQMDYRHQSAQGKELIADLAMSERAKSKAFQIAITFPSANVPLWIEGIVIASDMDQMLGFSPLSGKPALGGQQA